MAKFSPSFSICPLIDQQCFIDVRPDCDTNNIIVTMGRSIVMRFCLIDQQQVTSWTCQDKLSAAVVYDSGRQCYVGVFNNEYIGSWTNSKDLKKLRKKKLPGPIQDLHTYPGSRPILVFRNGDVSTLDLEGSSTTSVTSVLLPPGSSLSRSEVTNIDGTWYLVALVEQESRGELYFIALKGNDEFSITLSKQSHSLSSYSIAGNALVTVWNDGVWVLSPIVPEKFPGRRIGLLEGIDCKRIGAAASAGDGLVALAGPATSDEGACLCLLDVSRGLVAASARLKLLPSRPRLWVIDSWLLLPTGPSLTVVPFQRSSLRLDKLLGAGSAAAPPPVRAVWEGPSAEVHKLSKSDGIPEFAVAFQKINAFLEEKAVSEAVSFLSSMNDAPDACVVITLAALLQDPQDNIENIHTLLEVPVVADLETQKIVRSLLGETKALTLIEIIANSELTLGSILWSALLLDAFYQQLLLGDRNDVKKTLQLLQDRVSSAREEARAARELFCGLAAIFHRPPPPGPLSVQYAVDKLSLY